MIKQAVWGRLESIATGAVIFFTLLLLASMLSGCSTTGSAAGHLAPVTVERPHLRDVVRKEDVTCGDEPAGDPVTQKQANQLVKDKLGWGRKCKRASDLGWSVISQEP